MNEKDSQEIWYQHIEDTYCCRVVEELFGEKYVIKGQFGIGTFLRINCIMKWKKLKNR